MGRDKPIVDIQGGTFGYGGKAAVTNRHIPAIQVHSDARLTDVHVPGAPFAAVHNRADLTIRDCTNITPGHALVLEKAGDVCVQQFTSKRTSTGWTGPRFSEGWGRIFGKKG